jgi:hypothetical protein
MGTLLMLSGGADSAATLVKLLAESDEPVFAHHIVNRDVESATRHLAEDAACEAIVRHCRQAYRPFTYTKSWWHFPLPYFGWNLTLCAFVGARVLRSFPEAGIRRLALGIIDEPHTLGMWEERVREFTETFYAGLVTARLPYKPEIVLPVAHMTKRQALDFLPAPLTEVVSYCRDPALLWGNRFRPCGRCNACRTRMEAGRFP